jgi:hypothetical protein
MSDDNINNAGKGKQTSHSLLNHAGPEYTQNRSVHSAMHFRKNFKGYWACGRHIDADSRPADCSDCTYDVFLVDCEECQANEDYQESLRVKTAARDIHRKTVKVHEPNTNKPITEMSPEEIEAYTVWLQEK